MYEFERDAWMWSKNGRRLSLDNLSVDDIDIDEIATALGNTCRFAGHIPYYSVAEHSVIMSFLIEDDSLALDALLHDASEYLLTDVVKPFKNRMPEYEKYEASVQRVIDARYGIESHHPDVKLLDNRMVISESEVLFKHRPEWLDAWPYEPLPEFRVMLRRWLPEQAGAAFRTRFEELVP